jgi:hypothetical protein
MAFGLTLFMSTWCARENKRRDKKLLEREVADNVPWFRYTT